MTRKELKSLIEEIILTEKEERNISLRKLSKKEDLEEITKDDITDIENKINPLFDKLVPQSGPAETVEGEMIRSIVRIIYRYHNDGDFYFRGYGKQTVLPSVKWLTTYKTPITKRLKDLFILAKKNAPDVKQSKGVPYMNMYTDNDGYQDAIYSAASLIYKYVKLKNGKYTPNESEDSR